MKHSPNLRTAGRAGLAVSAAALLTFGLAAPAAADTVGTYEGSVRAQYVGNHETGETVTMSAGTIGTNLFRLQLEDGSELITYCIDIETGIRSSAWYREDDWANYPGKGDFAEPGKVHWILQNGYPSKGADEFNSLPGANRVEGKHALAATQAAIWHYSNGATLTRGHANVKAIYNHLIENAEELANEPAPTLSVTPDSATGQAGDTVGEFQISTNAAEVPISLDVPEGVELVDISTGEPVGESLSDGDKVGFSVPDDADAGEASFSLETTATVQQGRLFKGESAHKATQTLITAKDSEVSVKAAASVEWSKADEPEPEPTPEPEPSPSPSPTPTDEPDPKPTPTGEPSKPAEDDKPAPGTKDDEPTLPVTGGALLGLVAAGVAALGAGGGALYLSRKRKSGANGADLDA
ncbi:thioester domain-containing protein [Nocardiopsis exhalans]|uniref:Thioester domain-containing protein n=1 Tax=Nocardiopsis exhalans TaxID=163604 RepID=A0ABY5DC44_9ACTN|nr:thioester domain-containing protein [Nocardiopsis exhalans]USY21336.1 thioester domain-containing protein [Nocardiopsis exhalans]